MTLTWNRRVDWSSDNWRDGAACRDIDPDLFFPAGNTGDALDQIEYAKNICNGCAVKEQCLDFALRANQVSGIWGGTSEDERRKLRRQWLTARRRAMLEQQAAS